MSLSIGAVLIIGTLAKRMGMSRNAYSDGFGARSSSLYWSVSSAHLEAFAKRLEGILEIRADQHGEPTVAGGGYLSMRRRRSSLVMVQHFC